MQLTKSQYNLIADDDWLNHHFSQALLNEKIARLSKPEVIQLMLIAKCDSIMMCYAPLVYTNPKARIVLVGLTPGWSQMHIAVQECIQLRQQSKLTDSIDRVRGHQASYFAGSMRINLIKMLDDINVNSYLGLKSTSALFSSSRNLMHATSVLRYPVFKNQSNYTGYCPSPASNVLLNYMVQNIFMAEVSGYTDCLVIPLGKVVTSCMASISSCISNIKVVQGFPHPSSANGHRLKQFRNNLDWLKSQIGSLS